MTPLKLCGSIRMRSMQTGTTKWKEGTFEIVDKDSKVTLVVHYNVGGIPKIFQLNHNIKNVVVRPSKGKLCCLMITLKDSSFLTMDKILLKDADEMKLYLEGVQNRTHAAMKISQGSGSFGGVLGNRATPKDSNRQFPYVENQELRNIFDADASVHPKRLAQSTAILIGQAPAVERVYAPLSGRGLPAPEQTRCCGPFTSTGHQENNYHFVSCGTDPPSVSSVASSIPPPTAADESSGERGVESGCELMWSCRAGGHGTPLFYYLTKNAHICVFKIIMTACQYDITENALIRMFGKIRKAFSI